MTLAGRTVKRSQVAKDVAPQHHEFEPSKILDADNNYCNYRKQQQHTNSGNSHSSSNSSSDY